jgi:anti-sigma B factor antagonist
MILASRIAENHLVISLSGKIDLNRTTGIENDISRLIRDCGDVNVVLNLEEVEYISSSGLRIFITLKRLLNERNRDLRFCNLSNNVYRLFEIVELIDVFNVYGSEKEALTA